MDKVCLNKEKKNEGEKRHKTFHSGDIINQFKHRGNLSAPVKVKGVTSSDKPVSSVYKRPLHASSPTVQSTVCAKAWTPGSRRHGGIARIQPGRWHLPASSSGRLLLIFLSFPLPLSPPCIPAELRLTASWVSYPLYSHPSSSPQGLWGPHSSLALSGPLECLRWSHPRGAEPGHSHPAPHHGEQTVARWWLVRAAGEPDPVSEFLPPCPNKSRAANGSPWGPRTPSRTAPPLADRP